MTAVSGKELVLVEFEYEYTSREGTVISIKPNERYILLAKTNDHWWHVRKDERATPIYIPAKYVKQLPPDGPSPLDFLQPPIDPPKSPSSEPTRRPAEKSEDGSSEVTIRVHSPRRHKKKENRLSTFGVPLDIPDPVQKRGGVPDRPRSHERKNAKRRSKVPPAEHHMSQLPVEDGESSQLASKVPSFSPADPVIRPTLAKPVETPTVKDLEVPGPPDHPKPPAEFDDPPGPESDHSDDSENIYETISDVQGSGPHDSPVAETVPLHPLNPGLVPVPIPVPPPPQHPAPQVEPSSLGSDLNANVPELKRSAPHLAPPTSPAPAPSHPPAPPPRLSSAESDEWQVRTDRQSGREYFFNPASGHTSWDNPLSPAPNMEPESPLVVLSSPSPTSSPPPTDLDHAPIPPPPHGPAPKPAPKPTLATGSPDWEKLVDESSGRSYFYNHTSGETSWAPPVAGPPSAGAAEPPSDGPPPLPDEDYPMDDDVGSKAPPALPHTKRSAIPRASLNSKVPAGWTRSTDPEGKMVFTSEHTQEQWIKSVDERGQTYFYRADGSKSQWNLPELPGTGGPPKVGNGVDSEGVSVLKNWRHSMSPTALTPSPFGAPKEDLKFFPTHMRNVSDYGSDASSSPELPRQADGSKLQRSPSNQSSDSQHHVGSQGQSGPERSWAQTLEKAGILNKTKIAENGKRIRKNWAHSWTVLHGGVLTFHKDPKSAPAGNANKTNQIVPEFTVDLRGATVQWASKDKSSKKHVLELKTRQGTDYLVQYDTESIINDWHKVIMETIRQLEVEHHSEGEDEEDDHSPGPLDDKDKRREANRQGSTSSQSGETDQRRVRSKLRRFLQRRPTLQAVKEKGYIRDNVFGCNLDVLCMREGTNVPSFVNKCINAVEKRGLSVDGIYRVSGNLAVIQRLRHRADHEENLDLEDGQWEEVHVITGALKLFLRELPEPLFPYSFFERFIAAIKVHDRKQKVSFIRDLVKILPLPNLETMRVLFRHLRNVVDHGEENRMSVQSVAIVFGPTLLRPENESTNMAMHMIFQSQIVELILHEYDQIFGPN
ncbi:hypothetical protein GJAV_G00226550 [Gymnothorax javanicus]|nr:hypothetical protein GJAV_G00226550 [Gymnothorax javanicus]